MNTPAENLIANISKIALGASLVILMILGISMSANASNNNGENNNNKNAAELAEDSLMIEQILIDLEEIDYDLFAIETLQTKQMVEVFNADDQLVFSGSTEEWTNMKNQDLLVLKRKADLLFESENTQVYKVF